MVQSQRVALHKVALCYNLGVTLPFQDWFKEALPALIFQHIIQAKAVKVCSGISPIFGIIARNYGYDAYVVSVPGHFFNVVITPEGPIEVDLTAIQFQVCDFVKDDDTTARDPYGIRKALRRVLRHVIRDPSRAIKIQPYTGSMAVLQIPRVNDAYHQHYLDSFESVLEDVEALRKKDPEIYDLYDDIKYLEEWEADVVRQNPQRICDSCNEMKPHYSHKLCYLCYRTLQCRWLDDIDKWVDNLEKPQCQNLMHKMGFCKKHWKRIQQEERSRKNRDNPDFSNLYVSREERETMGVKESDIYKIVIYSAYLSQDDTSLVQGNTWLENNRDELPEDLQDMKMEDIYLTVRTSDYQKNFVWNITYHKDGIHLGGGLFCNSANAKRRDDEPGYHEVCTVGIALQGFRLYPTILKLLRGLLGPLRSDKVMTPGAIRSWTRAGGISRNDRWYLD